jgi:hypothetical protein
MINRSAKTSPQTYARTAGILFLIMLACSILSSMYVPSIIIVPGDATATAAGGDRNSQIASASYINKRSFLNKKEYI